MAGDSDIKFLLSHYVHFFQGDEAEGHRSFEGHHHKEQDTVFNELQGPVTKDLVEVQQHLRGCSAACCVHAPLCP